MGERAKKNKTKLSGYSGRDGLPGLVERDSENEWMFYNKKSTLIMRFGGKMCCLGLDILGQLG